LAGDTGLSRYYDFSQGPVAELKDTTPIYYREAVKYFLLHPEEAKTYLAFKGQPSATSLFFSMHLCSTNSPISVKTCDKVEDIGLTEKFYRGDRGIRESGMDISFRFGPYGADTIDYAPLDLNSLLYKIEMDLETISNELDKKHEAQFWHNRALLRKEKINQYYWNATKGLFYDFNFSKNEQSTYIYVTTFYPLWVGLATPEQALAIKNNLNLFEQKGGLASSTFKSGAQWDYPYGWAPFELIAIEGLRRYGYHEDADRLAIAFLSTVSENFHRDGTIREKYNVETASATTQIQVGYASNEIGFGWTNGVFQCLLHQLSEASH
jgi:alpha,alpha-trehalase